MTARGSNTAILAWLFTVSLLGLVGFRWFGIPESFGFLRPPIIAAVGLTPPAAVVSVFVGGYAFWRGGWFQRGLASICLVALVAWTFSDLRLTSDDDVIAASHLRIATVNIYVGNEDPLALIDEILTTDPDVILLQEVAEDVGVVVRSYPPLASYDERIGAEDGQGGRLVLSRLPLGNEGVEPLPPSTIVVAEVDVDGMTVEIVNVHIAAPVEPELSRSWARQLRDLSARVNQRRLPVIIAGDFNATVHHAEFRLMTEKGLTDAHGAVGSGLGFSWGPFGFPVMRIDHVLSSDELEPIRIQQLDGIGSDHHALVVDYRRRDG